ncbi:hypothetical protein HN865_02075 [Candidatus Woesearchaeota archaeon]|jgi:hypothetical protein|nr:hypothetical protein [Candidatus Woesearchaeota archaeon]MBT7237620.1 hypothetical protein [Candidatus Woesearchaeota archaeon]
MSPIEIVFWIGAIILVYILFKGGFGGCSHDWKQRGGSTNVGGGQFKKIFTCSKCYKIRREIS